MTAFLYWNEGTETVISDNVKKERQQEGAEGSGVGMND